MNNYIPLLSFVVICSMYADQNPHDLLQNASAEINRRYIDLSLQDFNTVTNGNKELDKLIEKYCKKPDSAAYKIVHAQKDEAIHDLFTQIIRNCDAKISVLKKDRTKYSTSANEKLTYGFGSLMISFLIYNHNDKFWKTLSSISFIFGTVCAGWSYVEMHNVLNTQDQLLQLERLKQKEDSFCSKVSQSVQ